MFKKKNKTTKETDTTEYYYVSLRVKGYVTTNLAGIFDDLITLFGKDNIENIQIQKTKDDGY